MVGNLLRIPLQYRDLVPHLCYVLLEVGGDNKGVELLEASLLLAPVKLYGGGGEQSHTPPFHQAVVIFKSCPGLPGNSSLQDSETIFAASKR